MKVLVCGGRDFNDAEKIYDVLDAWCRVELITEVIAGGARGADWLAKDWAIINEVEYRDFRADWGRYGKSAGILRNIEMLAESNPALVIAFPGGEGTAHMVRHAKDKGYKVIEIDLSNRVSS